MKLLQIVVLLSLLSSSFSLDPLSYDIYIRLPGDESAESFTASLSLHLRLLEPTTVLTLHSVQLSSFHNVSLIAFDESEHPLRGVRITSTTVSFLFDELVRGEYILHIGDYEGKITDGSAGVFARGSSLFTHLQPSFARRLIPCIDLPHVRTPFRISIEHSQDTVAFANTGSVEERLVGDRKVSIFGTTPALPAYLLAFSLHRQSIGQISAQTSFGVTVRVIGSHDATLTRVLRSSLRAFEYLSEVMRIPLPLNKMDIFLVEEYEGGMENWGHILISSTLASTGDDTHLLHLLAHELAHHWIGNAASVSSWAHICLQEDLTELVAHKTVKNLMEKNDYEQFRLAKYVEIQLAEDVVAPLDALILPPEITPQMIWTHCYLKGVIHLENIESIIGEEEMFAIIRSMITANSTFDLSTFTSHLSHFPVQDNITLSDVYYHAYTQGGYPTIDVSVSENSIGVDQSAPALWPLRLSLANGTSHWLFASSESLAIDEKTPLKDLLINLDFNAFMRVNYDNRTWNRVVNMLEDDPTQFTPVTRAQLISDLCFFSSSFSDRSLIDRAISVVNHQPHHFDLCDWTLLWCRNSQSLSPSSVLQKLLVNLSSIFTTASDYKCRSGQAVLAVNRVCRTFFGGPCI